MNRASARRRLKAARRALTQPLHTCTCDTSPGCPGCSDGFSDQCRFERRVRALEVAARELLAEASVGRPSTTSWLAHLQAIDAAAKL